MKKILLVSMPYGALERQAIGISLLKARLVEDGYDCDIKYFTFDFAELIGIQEYIWINASLPHTAFAGDWTFTDCLYDKDPERDQQYCDEILRQTWHLDDQAVGRLMKVKSMAGAFIDLCIRSVRWEEYSIIGFTSTFEQNIASLALARELKRRFPFLTVFFGGANWEGEMGLELHRKFDFVDYACSGEADNSFPAIVHTLEKYDCANAHLLGIKGLIYRHNGVSHFTGSPELIREMDDLPIPDYSNYFNEFSQSVVSYDVTPQILLETSRGCWWGAKSHCTFCGLNGGGMSFRSKSSERVIREIDELTEKWEIPFFEVVDNILDMSYFKDFLPELAASDRDIRLFYEVKANLNRKHVELLFRAGVHRIQPGIESMSNHVLKLMKKGTTRLQNILLLRLCKEFGIEVDWNVLYGFPGETQEDYTEMLDLFPFIRFLNPPVACGPVRLDRFSPYFNTPGLFGLKNLRAYRAYRYIYPFDQNSLNKIAYYFDFDYENETDPRGFADAVVQYAQEWKDKPENGILMAHYTPDGQLKLVDSRSDASYPELILNGPEQIAYEFCDGIKSLSSICRHLKERYHNFHSEEESIRAFLDSLVANRLMIEDQDKYLSLAMGLAVKERKNKMTQITLEKMS